MNESINHFEFRTFADDFGLKRDVLHYLATLEELDEQSDVYLITSGNHYHSVKVRDNCLEIKYLIQKKNGLEWWCPIFQAPFPLTAAQIQQDLFTSLNVVIPRLAYEAYAQKAFWDELIRPHPSIYSAHVIKHRFLFSYGSCWAEMSNLWINGTPMQTIAIADEDFKAVEQLVKELGLHSYENISYPLALERVMGLVPYHPAPKARLLYGSNLA